MTTEQMNHDRYVPKATGKGSGWAVWDRKLERFISDQELSAIPLDRLRDEKWPIT